MTNETNKKKVQEVAICDQLTESIESCIFTYRGVQVMVDRDLAMLYSVDRWREE